MKKHYNFHQPQPIKKPAMWEEYVAKKALPASLGRWRRSVLTVSILCALLLGIFSLLFLSKDYLIARYWEKRLALATEESTLDLLRNIAALGRPGIPILADALTSERHCISFGAQQVLGEEINRWRESSSPEEVSLMMFLADELSRRMRKYSPAVRLEVARLANVMLEIPLENRQGIDRTRLLDACEKILDIAAPTRNKAYNSALESAQNALHTPSTESSASLLDRNDSAIEQLMFQEMGMELPAGGLIFLPTDENGASPSSSRQLLSSEGSRDTSQNSSAAVEDNEASDSPRGGDDSSELNSSASLEKGERSPPDAAVVNGDLPGGLSAQAIASLDPEERRMLLIMRQLHHADPDRVREAEHELSRKGFSAQHRHMAKQLTDDNPRVRRDLASNLPAVEGISAKIWLLVLSRDKDAEVRRSAVSVMATNSDRELLSRLQAMSNEDEDEDIRRMASKAVSARDDTTRR